MLKLDIAIAGIRIDTPTVLMNATDLVFVGCTVYVD